MRIINSNATTVPFGDFQGMDLQAFAEQYYRDARELMRDRRLRIEFPDHFYDLEVYLQAVPRARRYVGRWRR